MRLRLLLSTMSGNGEQATYAQQQQRHRLGNLLDILRVVNRREIVPNQSKCPHISL